MPSSSSGTLGAFTSSASVVSSWISLQAPSSAYAAGATGSVSPAPTTVATASARDPTAY